MKTDIEFFQKGWKHEPDGWWDPFDNPILTGADGLPVPTPDGRGYIVRDGDNVPLPENPMGEPTTKELSEAADGWRAHESNVQIKLPGVPILKALLEAQRSVGQVPHDKKFEGRSYSYTYSSAEAIIKTCREALLANGLGVRRTALNIDKEHMIMSVTRRLFHAESGGELEETTQWPLVTDDYRPADKSVAGALTNSLAYYLRDLLLLERGHGPDDDMNARDDSGYRPKSEPKPQPAKTQKKTVKMPTTSRAELIAKLSPEQLKEKVLTGSRQIMALDTTTDESEELVEATQGDYSPEMLEKVWTLFDKVKARVANTADVDLF